VSVPVELPNGIVVSAINAIDARVLHHEVFESDLYWRHGITLHDGAVVFDVGANIGLYSISLSRRFRRLKIHAFEPIPPVFDALCANRSLCGDAELVAHPFGIARVDGVERFVFDPQISYAGSSHLHELRRVLPRSVGGSVRQPFVPSRWVSAVVEELVVTGLVREGRAVHALRRMLRSAPGRALLVAGWLALYGLLVVRRLVTRCTFDCEVRRFSRVKRELGVAAIDLVKIDVEGAELEVLQGIDDADWPDIGQLLVEVHDVDGRVDVCRELLSSKGYAVAVEPDPRQLRRLLRIYQLYARRRGASG